MSFAGILPTWVKATLFIKIWESGAREGRARMENESTGGRQTDQVRRKLPLHGERLPAGWTTS